MQKKKVEDLVDKKRREKKGILTMMNEVDW